MGLYNYRLGGSSQESGRAVLSLVSFLTPVRTPVSRFVHSQTLFNNVFSTQRLSSFPSLWPCIFGIPCLCFRCSLFHTVWAETFELLPCDCFCPSFTHSRIAFYVYELCWGITWSIIRIGLCHAAMLDGLPLKRQVLLSWIFFCSDVPMCVCPCGIPFIKLIRRVIAESGPPVLSSPHPKQTRTTHPPLCLQNGHAHSTISPKQEEVASQIKQSWGKREQYWPYA